MQYLILDTETTGITSFAYATRKNFSKWPRMVQLAWMIVDEEGYKVSEYSNLIRPLDFKIPMSSVGIHGITDDLAQSKGVEIEKVLNALKTMISQVDAIVAHNLKFDIGIIQSESYRIDLNINFPEARYCTVFGGIRYLKKYKRFKNPKFPRLDYLYEELFGIPHSGKHDALADVIACKQIFFRLKKMDCFN